MEPPADTPRTLSVQREVVGSPGESGEQVSEAGELDPFTWRPLFRRRTDG